MSQYAATPDRVFREETLAAHQRGVELSIAIMRESFGEPLSLDDLARSAFMSRYHFTRVFTKTTGVSPGRFLAAIRMQQAKRLLLKTDRSVTDISLDVGYNSLGTFTRLFSDFVGLSPLRFRRLAAPLCSLALSSLTGLLRSETVLSTNAIFTGEMRCDQALAFTVVGLFRTGIPRSLPDECLILQGSTRFAFRPKARRIWYIHAMGMLPGATIEDAILCTPGRTFVGSCALNATLRQPREFTLELQGLRVNNPPVVLAFAVLLAESLFTTHRRHLGSNGYSQNLVDTAKSKLTSVIGR